MKLYTFLSGISFLKKYNAKFMFIAFIGINIPLLGLLIFLIISSASTIDKISFALLATGLTLLASVITLSVLNWLVTPLRKTQYLLKQYIDHQSVPNFPENYDDEVGQLMRDLNTLISGQRINEPERADIIKALSIELRAPAAYILSLTTLIQSEKNPDKQAHHLKCLEQSVNRQLQLMDNLIGNYKVK